MPLESWKGEVYDFIWETSSPRNMLERAKCHNPTIASLRVTVDQIHANTTVRFANQGF